MFDEIMQQRKKYGGGCVKFGKKEMIGNANRTARQWNRMSALI